MVLGSIASRVVPYPTVILRVNVGRFRMPLLIPVSPPLLSRLWLLRLSAAILLVATLLALLLTSIIALPLLRRSPRRLRPALRYVPLANSLLSPAALLLSLLPSLLLLPAFFLRKGALHKRRRSKHQDHGNKSRKKPRKPSHRLLQSQNPNEIVLGNHPAYATPHLTPKLKVIHKKNEGQQMLALLEERFGVDGHVELRAFTEINLTM